MILFLSVTACVLAVLVVVLYQTHQQSVRIENWRAGEAERRARENTAPLGNAERLW